MNRKWSRHFIYLKLTLLLLVQVSTFSLSDILRLWPFVRVGSATPLSATMLTSLPVSVRAAPSTLSSSLLIKFLDWLRFARLRMTTRPRQLLPCTFNLVGHTLFPLKIWLSSIWLSSWTVLIDIVASECKYIILKVCHSLPLKLLDFYLRFSRNIGIFSALILMLRLHKSGKFSRGTPFQSKCPSWFWQSQIVGSVEE